MALTFITTLNAIKAHNPCKDGWEKLLSGLGKTKADNEPLHLRDILSINGVQDCIWAFRCFPSEYDCTWRLMAADFAEQVLHIYEDKYPNDNRPRKAIQAARDYANGLISKEDAHAADSAADAAYAAAFASDAAADAASDAAACSDADYDSAREKQAEIILKYIS